MKIAFGVLASLLVLTVFTAFLVGPLLPLLSPLWIFLIAAGSIGVVTGIVVGLVEAFGGESDGESKSVKQPHSKELKKLAKAQAKEQAPKTNNFATNLAKNNPTTQLSPKIN